MLTSSEYKLPFGYEYSREVMQSGMAPTTMFGQVGSVSVNPKEVAKNAYYKQQYSLVNKLAKDYASAKTPAEKFKAQEKYVKERKVLDSFNLQNTQSQIDALAWFGNMGSGLAESGPTYSEDLGSTWEKTGDMFVIKSKTRTSSFPNWQNESKLFKQNITDGILADQWNNNAGFLFADNDKDGTINAVDCNLTNSCKQSNWILDGRTMNCKKYKSRPIQMQNKQYGLIRKNIVKKGDMLSRLKGLF